MPKKFLSVVYLALCLAVTPFQAIFCQTAAPTAQQASDFPTFPTHKTLWHEVLSPKNSEVLALFNNRPFSFESGTAFHQKLDQAEPRLKEALNCAVNMLQSPRDTVGCLCNLGCLYFLSGRYDSSHKCFSEAIDAARKATSPGSSTLAPLLDYDALALRGAATTTRDDKLRHNRYEECEARALESLQIRTKVAGYYQPDVAHTLMNLACLYHDRALDDRLCSPEERTRFSNRAHDLEIQVDQLMNPRPNKANVLLAQALEYRNRAQRTEASDPQESWEYMNQYRQLLDQADQLKTKMVLVNSRDLSNNPPCPRPFYPCMPVSVGMPKLPEMVAYAESIIEKCKRQSVAATITATGPTVIPPPPPPAGFATVIGNWNVPSDITTRAEIATGVTSKETVEGVERRSGHGEQESKVADQEIFLCRFSDYGALYSAISRFAASRGLEVNDIGRTWPANHQQAERLLLELKAVANNIKIESKKTDKNGDYEIGADGTLHSSNGRIPKGKYFLYASIVTQEQCAYWILPGPTEPLTVSKVEQFRFDFQQNNALVIWTRGQ